MSTSGVCFYKFLCVIVIVHVLFVFVTDVDWV